MVLEKSPFPEGFLSVDLRMPKTNPINNASFEVDGEWVTSGAVASVTQDTFMPLDGSYAARVVIHSTPASTTSGVGLDTDAVAPGQWVAARIPIRPDGAIPTPAARIRITFLDSVGATISTVTSSRTALSAFSYNYLTVSGQAPEGTALARVFLFFSNSGSDVPVADSTGRTDAWMAGLAATQAEAEAAAAGDFFEGTVEEWRPVGEDLDQSGVTLSHGVRSEGGSADVSQLEFSVRNPDGKYSARNPASPLAGLIGRNTPARATAALGAPWLDLEEGGRATTPDTAGLSMTGDHDIQWWGERDSWASSADLISKYSTTGDQRSWILRAEAGGTLTLFWYPDGVTLHEARSEAQLPVWAGRIAIRATLDVNNGAGGHTVRFEYAAAPGGPWVQLGGEIVGSGVTSVFDSTAALTLGKEPTSSALAPVQRVHGFSVANGIGNPAVVSRTFASLTPGATSFVDDQGRTWTITVGSITNRHVLAVCEVAEWPMDWGTKGAESVMTEIEANGPTRRLGQGAERVESVLYRTISATGGDMIGYWPMEDGTDAAAFGPAIGRNNAAMGTDVRPAAYDAFPGSAPIPTLGASRVRAEIDRRPSTGEVQVRWVQWTPDVALADAEVVLARVEFADGNIGHVDLRLRDSDGALGIFGYDMNDVELAGSTFFALSDIKGDHVRLSIELEQNGSAVDWRWVKLAPGASGGLVGAGTFTSRTVGRVVRVILNATYKALGDIAMGHLTVESAITSIYDVSAQPLVGYIGEQADNRMVRLAAENGASLTVHGRWSTPMGEQQEETFLELLAEAAEADGGILHDDTRALGLRYRTLDSMGDQPAVTIPYTDNLVTPFRPSDDDALTRNRITVSRPSGTRVTEEATEGRLSTQRPPAGVGVYDESLTLNLYDDNLVQRTATWRLHVGTWDEGRYPTLGVDLAHPYFLANPELTRDLLSLTPGDRLVITDPPPWLPPRSVDVLVMGIQIEITPLHAHLQWSCVPARPYRVGYFNAGHRWSAAETALAAGVSASSTTLALTLPAGVTWTHADGDYDIEIGGEVMTVTNVVDGDTMTVTRSVNGVALPHPAGSLVALAEPSFYAR